MKRLCFLSPNVEHARKAIGALRGAGIADRHLYVVARQDINLEGLPDAGPEDDDFLPAYERGLAIGGVGGLLAGLLAMAFPITGFVVGGAALMLVTLYGAGFGGLLSALAGSAFPSSRLEKFQEAIEAGKLLILADVTDDDIARCETAVREVDPEIELEGIEPPVPMIP